MDIENVKNIRVMKNSIRFLRIFFIFPSEKQVNEPNKKKLPKYTVMNIIGSYFPIGVMLHLVMNIKNGTLNYLDEDMMVVLSYSGVAYFGYQFYKGVQRIVIICKQLSDFESFGKPKNFDRRNEILNKIAIGYFIYHIIVILFETSTNLFLIENCYELNKINGIDEVCGLMGRIWLPFDYDYFPLKQIVYIYELIFGLVIFQNAGVISYFMFESVEHINIRFRHLCDVFEEVVKITDPVERRAKFRRAMQYHHALIDMGNLIKSCYSPCCMVHIILSAPVLGATGFRLVNSEMLGNAVYQTEWYNLDIELQKDLMLVIVRSCRPIFITAGPFGPMTYTMMLAIGKASYSYLTYLQTMI